MPGYEWDDNDRPLAFFITFRTHGTWLHGDLRESVDRHGRNIYGHERIGLDPVFSVTMDRNMNSEPFILDGRQRACVEAAIRNVCALREFNLVAINIRTNHGHVVVAGPVSPNTILNAFKANATRELREAGLVTRDQKIWSRGGSKKYLWKQHDVDAAVEYTVNGQGDDLPKF